MKKITQSLLLAIVPLSFIGCETGRKNSDLEMITISKAYLNIDGHPVIDFKITNSQEAPICLPISMFEGKHTYYANLEIKTKYGRRLKEKRIKGKIAIDDAWEFVRIDPKGQRSNSIIIKRETLRKRISGKSDLRVRLKFWGGYCLADLEPKAVQNFIAISNQVELQQ